MSRASTIASVEAFEAEVQAQALALGNVKRSGVARSKVLHVDLPRPKDSTRTCALYLRISRDVRLAEIGVSRQLNDALRIAASNRWHVVAIYIDDDLSAFLKSVKRNAYLALIESVRRREIDAAVFWDLDRFWRQPRELEAMFDLLDDNALDFHVAAANATIDLMDESQRLMARINVAVAHKSSADTRRRVSRAKLDGAQQGANSGGPRPFGFNADRMTIREDEALVIKRAAERVLSGVSTYRVAQDLTDEGVKTPNGRDMCADYLRRILMSDRVAGWRTHHGERTARAQWPAILSDETHDALVALYTDPSRRSNREQHHERMLLGIAVCGIEGCGARLYGAVRRSGRSRTLRPMYVCKKLPGHGGCWGTTRNAQRVDEYVSSAIRARLVQPDVVRALTKSTRGQQGIADAAVVVRKLEQRLDDLADAYAEGEITRSQMQRATAKITPDLDRARSLLVELRAVSASAGALSDPVGLARTFAELGIDERTAVASRLIERVVCRKQPLGATFDPSCVEIEWRDLAS